MELIVILWVVFSAIVGQHAHHYGRSGLAWFLAALIFSPILVGVVALIAGRPYAYTTAAGGSAPIPRASRYMIRDGRMTAIPEAVPCPFCAEPIRPQAIKCKHCGSEVAPLVQGDGMSATEAHARERELLKHRAQQALH